MPILVKWDNPEQTIIYENFEGAWTWEEFNLTAQKVADMMKSVSHEVHLLSDFTSSGPLPIGGAMTQARNVMKYYPPNWRLIVVITPSAFIRSLVTAFRKAFYNGYGKKTHATQTVAEAYTIIERYMGKVTQQ